MFVPSRHQQAHRQPLVQRERLTVERVREHRLGRQRLLTVQRAAELLLHLERLRPPLDVFLSAVGTEEDELARLRLHACFVEHGLQRHARPPRIARQSLQRPSIARAFEASYQFRVPHLAEVVERQRQRPVDESRDL